MQESIPQNGNCLMSLYEILKRTLRKLNPNNVLGENKSDFYREIDFMNHNRLIVFSIVLTFIHIPLILVDYIRLSTSNIPDIFGAQIILFAHSAVLITMIIFYFICRNFRVNNPHQIKFYHHVIFKTALILMFFLMMVVTIGDILINKSIIAYMGGLFAFSVIPLLRFRFSMALYFLNSILLITIILFMDINQGILLNYQVNLAVFTVTAWVMSRYLFSVQVSSFLSRKEKEQLIGELQEAVANVDTLSGLIPICSQCKKIRDDKGYWNQLESYIHKHSQAKFSHGICPECVAEFYPDIKKKDLP